MFALVAAPDPHDLHFAIESREREANAAFYAINKFNIIFLNVIFCSPPLAFALSELNSELNAPAAL